MALLDIIRKRYSCRAYQSKPVEQEKLDRIIEAARLAPSAKNCQQWRFVIVRDPSKLAQMPAICNGQGFIAQASAVFAGVAVFPDYIMGCGQAAAPIDVAIAMEHIALQAAEEGLGTCWIGSFDRHKVKALLNIPKQMMVIELMTLGYPADHPRPKDRLSLEQIACYDTWTFS